MDNSVDAWVVLGTKLDSKQFERDLKKEINEMNKLTNEAENLSKRKVKLQFQLDKSYTKELEELKEKYNIYMEGFGEAGTPATEAYTQTINERFQKKLDALNSKYSVQITNLEEINKKINENAVAQDLVKNKIETTTDELIKQRQLDFGAKQIKQVSDGANNFFKKITKIGLAIFGIRSLYLGIRRIMSGVLSQNEKLKNQYDGIMTSLSSAFAPIIQKIINLVLKLMGYINAIWKKLFGHDLFKATSKSAQKTAGAAKEINKQLAGFDEANVLSSNKGGDSDGTGSIKIPNLKLPDWLDKLLDFVKKHPKLAGFLFGTAAFTLFGLGKIGGAITAEWAKKLIGSKGAGALASGAKGLLGILGTLALLTAAVWLIKVDYDKLKELNDAIDDLTDSYARNKAILDDTENNQNKYNDAMEKSTGLTEKQEEVTQGHIQTLINEQLAQAGSTKGLELGRKQLNETIKAYSEKYRQGQLTEEQEKTYAKFIRENLVGAFAAGASGAKTMEEDLKALDTKYNTDYTLKIQEKGIDDFKKQIDGVAKGMDKLIDKWKTVGDKVVASFGMTQTQYKNVFHAAGGIVNLPGRGVPVNHMAGEAGREGIIPMDNQQQMEVLGQAIAKYVNITNYVTTNVDSRKLNQILKQSENKERLANNW